MLNFNIVMKKQKLTLMMAALTLFAAFGCDDEFVTVDPGDGFSDEQTQELAQTNPELLLSLIGGFENGNNLYLNSFNTGNNGGLHDDFGHMAVNMGTDLMSNDMLMDVSHWFVNFYNYTGRVETSNRTDMAWSFYYRVVYNVNSALPATDGAEAGTDIGYLRGRLLAMRAFGYTYLVRLYADGDTGIPLYTTESSDLTRVSTATIKAQILEDLTAAYDLLQGYSRTSKVAVNQNVVAGFLARYHLDEGNYAQAASYAASARAGYVPMQGDDLFDGFNKIGNPEWMWGADITAATTTFYASFFSQIGSLNPGYAGLLGVFKKVDKRVYDAIPNSDVRKEWFNGPAYGLDNYVNVKFFDDTTWEGDYVFMRAAEMYLIEAEAKALNGDDAGARQTLFDLVSTRNPNYSLSTNSGAALVSEIRTQRSIELWGEGFAFYDMKRQNRALNRDYPGTNHSPLGLLNYPAGSEKFNFQIPISELNANPNITQQNPL